MRNSQSDKKGIPRSKRAPQASARPNTRGVNAFLYSHAKEGKFNMNGSDVEDAKTNNKRRVTRTQLDA